MFSFFFQIRLVDGVGSNDGPGNRFTGSVGDVGLGAGRAGLTRSGTRFRRSAPADDDSDDDREPLIDRSSTRVFPPPPSSISSSDSDRDPPKSPEAVVTVAPAPAPVRDPVVASSEDDADYEDEDEDEDKKGRNTRSTLPGAKKVFLCRNILL